MLGQFLTGIPSLKRLDLTFMLSKLGDKGADALLIHPLPGSIRELTIDLTANQLTHKGVSNLHTFLKNIPSDFLKGFTLILGSNRMGA